tara:strand:- start:532 stop:954 length:423 start_codon:yes stop_codon:yes gene_type:complete
MSVRNYWSYLMDITKQLVEYLEDNTQLHVETIQSPLHLSADGTTVMVPSWLVKAIDHKEDWWKLIDVYIIPKFKTFNYVLSAELIKKVNIKKDYYSIILRSVSLDIPLNDLNTQIELEKLSQAEGDEIQAHVQAILGNGI